jgi:hypothetical protein
LRLVRKVTDLLDERAPPSDKACDWDWPSMRCQPAEACALRYKVKGGVRSLKGGTVVWDNGVVIWWGPEEGRGRVIMRFKKGILVWW